MNVFPTRQDIIYCYHLALGREPESEAVIHDKLNQPTASLLPDFFSSPEFSERVRRDITQASPPQPCLRLPPSPEIKAWTAEHAPLSPEGAEAVRAAGSWASLYRALFADEVFAARVLNEAAQATNWHFVHALAAREQAEAAIRIEGRVELVTPHEIRGWALDRAEPQRRLCLELWIEGAFRGATTLDRYRPDLQGRFGGNGMFGFVMARPLEPQGSRSLSAELREASSGRIIDILQLSAVDTPRMDAALAVQRELAEVRALLARIEQRLPDVNEAYSFALELYGDYFENYYAPLNAAAVPGPALPDLVAIIDATLATPGELDGAMASLAGQGRAPRNVAVAHPGGDLRLDFEHVLSLWQGRFEDPQSPRGVLAQEGWAAAMQAGLAIAAAPHILLMDARSRLAPDASQRVCEALRAGAALVYGDSDVVELRADGQAGRHRDPAFRTTFDAELFLQQGDLGPVVGVSRPFMEAGVGWEAEQQAGGLFELALQGLDHPEYGSFVHISRVLSHAVGSSSPAEPFARMAALKTYLAAQCPGADAVPHADLLGATLPSAFRIRRALPAPAHATVIVPTRDRLDLLEPCLTRLAASAKDNQGKFDVLVVDNQSQEPETFAFLERFGRNFPLHVIPHDGAFNWALMNNRAATQTDADVLIFLNNDTAALSPDWCDELCSQVMRPEVGAVGARLLYADGTVQHAGVVAGGWHAFAAHEGVGAPGQETGYLGRHALLREVSAVTGACLATRRSAFESLGGFDALSLPIEGNDIDYCFRIRAAGLKVLYDPYCTFYHFESKSRGLNVDPLKRQQAEAAGLLMRARWGETYRSDPFYNPHFDRVGPPLTRLGPPPNRGAPSSQFEAVNRQPRPHAL